MMCVNAPPAGNALMSYSVPSETRRLVGPVDTTLWGYPWPGVLELARSVPCEHWTLVGGLMVQLHCFLNDVGRVRPTADIDTLAHVEITGRSSLGHLKAGLRKLGYHERPSLSEAVPLHRFVREGTWTVDFLIADHVAPSVLRTLPTPTPVMAPGGTNALNRTMEVDLEDEIGQTRISVPDIVGALMLKIEAYKVDSRDRVRHLQDATTLAHMLDETNAGPPLRGEGPTRIRRLMEWLDDDRTIQDAGIDQDAADDAIIALDDLLRADPGTPEGDA